MYFASHLYNYIVVSFTLNFIVFDTGALQFTKTPNDTRAFVGGDVRIVWDYRVVDKNSTFSLYSPVWNYYNGSGATYELASEYLKDNWKWKISPTCPARLLSPVVRIRKEGNATLVITNVSLADSGKYECELNLLTGSVPPNSMQLTVLVRPTTAPPSSSTTAPKIPTTTPTPNITTTASTPSVGGLSTGEIVGIVIGVLVLVGIIGGCCFWFLVKKKRAKGERIFDM